MKPVDIVDIIVACDNLYWIKLGITMDNIMNPVDINLLMEWCEKNINRNWSFKKLSNGVAIVLSSKEDMTYVLMKAKCSAIEGDNWKASLL